MKKLCILLMFLPILTSSQEPVDCHKPNDQMSGTISELQQEVEQIFYSEEETQKLFNAILANDLNKVKLALKNKANPNAINDNFKYYRNPKIFGNDYFGYNVLSFAINKSSPQIVKALLDSGADPNLPNANAKATTPLIEVARDNSTQYLDVLLDPKYKLDINKTSASGRSALHFAATHNSHQVIERLVKQNHIDLNIESFVVMGEGNTALTAASFYGNVQSVQALLNHSLEAKPITLGHLEDALKTIAPSSDNENQINTIKSLINDYKKKHYP